MDIQLIAVTLLCGLVVGFLFGLTGNGGSTLAVPLLVYGLHLRPHAAVCTSMIAVGVMATARVVQTSRAGSMEPRLGGTLALAGLAGAPVGALLGRQMPERWLLWLFAVLVLAVAARLWNQETPRPSPLLPDSTGTASEMPTSPSSENLWRLRSLGLGTGALSGLLGVGGGFVLVPGLVLLGRLEIHRAMATAMFSVALTSLVAMAAHLALGQVVPWATAALFTVGAVLGLEPGARLSARLSGTSLRRTLTVVLLALALFIMARSLAAVRPSDASNAGLDFPVRSLPGSPKMAKPRGFPEGFLLPVRNPIVNDMNTAVGSTDAWPDGCPLHLLEQANRSRWRRGSSKQSNERHEV
jgi:uncharacterized membrane protein YfcA